MGDNLNNRAFGNCPNISTLTIGDSVMTIPNNAFSEWTNLTSITIPNSVISIGGNSFQGCSSVTSVIIPNTVTSIGDKAFSDCIGLSSVVFNANNCTFMGSNASKRAFYNCPNITTLTIGDSVTTIPNYAFTECTRPTSLTIPTSVTSIGDKAFYGCTGLTSAVVPNSVISFGEEVFTNCSGLTSVVIGNKVPSIGNNTFKNCDHLANITFGSRVVSLGSQVLDGCNQLTNIYLKTTAPPLIEVNSFANIPSSVIFHVQCGSLNNYLNASAIWNTLNLVEEVVHDFSVTTSDPARGTVQIINAPTCDNLEAEIQANPYHGYHFSRWSDGDTHAHRYIVVVQDTNLQAYFLAEGETEGIDETDREGCRIWASDGRIHVSQNGVETSEWNVYDITGREVSRIEGWNESVVLPTGIYLVKVGTLPAQKIFCR